MLYLVTAEVTGPPAAPTLESLERGLATLERLRELQLLGVVQGAGIYAGRMGMCFRVDVGSNTELHQLVASLPTFMEAQWQVTPLVGLEDDIVMTQAAVEHFRSAPDA